MSNKFILYFVFLSFIGPFEHVNARPLDDILKSGFIRIFVYEDNPPFSFKDHENLNGIDVNIGVLVGAELGIDVRFITGVKSGDIFRDAIRLLSENGENSADLVMHVPDTARSSSKQQLFSVFGFYLTQRFTLLLDTEKAKNKSLRDFLSTAKIGVVGNSVSELKLGMLLDQEGGVREQIVRYRNIAAAIEGFRNKEVSGFYGVHSEAELTAKSAGRNVGVVQPDIGDEINPHVKIGLAVSNKSPDLQNRLKLFINDLKHSERLLELFDKAGFHFQAAK